MYPRNFGCNKIVRTYVRPPLHVSWGEILHFKHPELLTVNPMATWTFRERGREKKKPQQQNRVLLSSILMSKLMSKLTWETEK